jgi:CrcB protein
MGLAATAVPADGSYDRRRTIVGNVLAVAVAGALGALARYGADTWIERRTDSVFPWATFAINISGCLGIALAVTLLAERHAAPGWLRAAVAVGFLGAYTTFSTFAFETHGLLVSRDFGLALLYTAGSVVVGLAAIYLGVWLGRAVG